MTKFREALMIVWDRATVDMRDAVQMSKPEGALKFSWVLRALEDAYPTHIRAIKETQTGERLNETRRGLSN